MRMALRALGRRHDCMRSARRWLSAERKVRPALRLESGACGLPHPQKRATGGEDAWFISGNTVGVADGVGGWARKVIDYAYIFCMYVVLSWLCDQGIDSGEYSRTLMNSAKRTVTASDKTPTPLQVLTVAHRSAQCPGSSTACIVQLKDLSLQAINLGDSGFLLCRLQPDKAEGGALRWQVVHETPNQCHYFNCPYQLGFGANGDKPEMGEVYDLETQEGDVIVLGTDGLYVLLVHVMLWLDGMMVAYLFDCRFYLTALIICFRSRLQVFSTRYCRPRRNLTTTAWRRWLHALPTQRIKLRKERNPRPLSQWRHNKQDTNISVERWTISLSLPVW
ncbi:hypothetical protein PPTG_11799 [Phytophthora nicotianae INRA-310]|uniref:Protein phosphatase n=3 Tax=Phytophthora nicotianae TaxID=4792 RepID=W2Q892_PHYN3|nr:hypothetical protein PPTG_11799 [Phytophthora nicotianae INRA-310]ETI47277.1 hypothetical protein F443_08437 [Phytophthora nicotianae P1569]ETM47055.1 hypothetical protein L914_08154 [Phytophthora nicotianae]ETN09388.1 hypothetical protein PPTG_11799 [Phytophthora nicotianae INRA-310]